MTAITTPRLKDSTDSLLRFAMRADAIITGLTGIAGIPLAGWLAETSGTTLAFEYAMSAFFIAYGWSCSRSLRGHRYAGPASCIASGNVLYTVAAVRLRARRRLPVDHHRCGAHTRDRRLHAGIAELQYQGVRRIKA